MAYAIPEGSRADLEAVVRATGLSTDDAIARLTYVKRGESPAQPLLVLLARHEEVTPRLLDELALSHEALLDRISQDASGDTAYLLHQIAIYLLALFEEPRAFPLLMRYLAADTHAAAEHLDDTVTEDLTAIVARIYDGSDLTPLKAIIEDPAASIYVRSALLSSLHALERKGRLDRGTVVDYFEHVLETCCTPDNAEFSNLLAVDAARLKEARLLPLIDRYYAAGMIDITGLPRRDIDAFFNDTQDDIDRSLLQAKRFDSLIDYICDWPWFHSTFDERRRGGRPIGADGGLSVARDLAWMEANTFYPPTAKIGRNEPCHCGSGKKYKKCCLESDRLR